MIIRSALAAAAILMASAPAMAQEATPAPSAAEVAFEAKANAFNERMQTLQAEIQTVLTASTGDANKLSADIDAINAKYASDIEAFAVDVEQFLDGQIAAATDDAQRQQLTAARQASGPSIRNIPQQIKAAALQAASQPAAAPSQN